MADRPILFSGPMVRALLAGTKTQTRRILKPQPEQFTVDDQGTLCEVSVLHVEGDRLPRITLGNVITAQEVKSAVGDRLWVKETWRPIPHAFHPWDMEVIYNANGEHRIIKDGEFGENDWTMPKAAERGNVSPLFMPRWASRLTLTITDVRIQRLRDISREDAIAEGLIRMPTAHGLVAEMGCDWGIEGDARCGSPISTYAALWERINGAGAWDTNPWVAAYTFTVERGNIDQLRAAS